MIYIYIYIYIIYIYIYIYRVFPIARIGGDSPHQIFISTTNMQQLSSYNPIKTAVLA